MKKIATGLILLIFMIIPCFSVTAACNKEVMKYTIELYVDTDDNYVGGYVCGTGEYSEGEQVMIVAIPYDGYTFNGWSDGNNNQVRYLEMKDNYKLTAEFKKVQSLVISSVDAYMLFGFGGSGFDYIGISYLDLYVNGGRIKVFNQSLGSSNDAYMSFGLYSGGDYYTSGRELQLYVERNSYNNFDKDTTLLNVLIKSEVIGKKGSKISKKTINKNFAINPKQDNELMCELMENSEMGYSVYLDINFEIL